MAQEAVDEALYVAAGFSMHPSITGLSFSADFSVRTQRKYTSVINFLEPKQASGSPISA